ncbi:AbrB family transcriptional regulator [Terrilactibacillus sp. S3-3]|nr:AbrB family transcriptional regulator [Terrilactibacillus sp. S3-3]
MERKIFEMGNSCGSTYPREVLEHLGVKPGDEITFENLSDGSVKIRKRKADNLPDEIDPEFIEMKWLMIWVNYSSLN